MRVRAIKSFGGVTAEGRFHVSAGQELDLPDGADWLRAGLVEPVETAAVASGKPRVTKTRPATDVPGIGDSYAEALAELGIESAADVATMDPARVASAVDGVGMATAQRWQQAAREML